ALGKPADPGDRGSGGDWSDRLRYSRSGVSPRIAAARGGAGYRAHGVPRGEPAVAIDVGAGLAVGSADAGSCDRGIGSVGGGGLLDSGTARDARGSGSSAAARVAAAVYAIAGAGLRDSVRNSRAAAIPPLRYGMPAISRPISTPLSVPASIRSLKSPKCPI